MTIKHMPGWAAGVALGLILTFGARLAYAACITPKMLTDAATAAVADTTDPMTPGDKDKGGCNFVRSMGKSVGLTKPDALAPTTVADQVTALKGATDVWEHPVPQSSPGDDAATTTGNRKTFLTRMQSWANFGEFVIAVDQGNSQIAIVTPGDLDTQGTGKWADFPAPQIAFSGEVAPAAPAKKKADAKMYEAKGFSDPMTIDFYRYKL
jgi:hypothetical protein